MDKPCSTIPRWRPLAMLGVLVLAGCPNAPRAQPGSATDNAPPPAAVAIRVTVADDPHLAETIKREWQAHSENEVTLRPITSEELLAAKRINTDVLIAPAELLGDLVEADRLTPLTNDALADKEIAREAFFPRLRNELVTWGKTTYALPLGAPTFQLLYRSDIFEKLSLTPPATWADYQDLLLKLADREALGGLAPPADTAWSASAEPLAPGWGNKLLLVRAAGYVADANNISPFLDLTTLEPRIAAPTFERALEELAAAAQEHPDWLKLTPDSARAELLAGRCAMAVTWPSGVRTPGEPTEGKSVAIRIAPLPGKDVAYLGTAGYVAAVARDCRRPSVAMKFITWLTGPDSSARISSQCWAGSPTRDTQAPRARYWINSQLDEAVGEAYFTLLQADHTRPLFLSPLRLPKRIALQAALDGAVMRAVKGENSPPEALTAAAAQWKQTLGEIDAEQARAYARRSLNLSQ